MTDEFGDRMKLYESTTAYKCMPLLPVCARLDGKCFSNFTKNYDRPFDWRIIDAMCLTTQYLVEETNALVGYTQSDEITLIWYSGNIKSQIFFDGKLQKMISVLASMATGIFNGEVDKSGHRRAVFDCRVWQVPNLVEACNVLLWREKDAIRNSVSMLAHEHFSKKQLFKKSKREQLNMLESEGVIWGEYPPEFKRGTYYQRQWSKRKFTADELDRLPQKHKARKNPDLEIERSDVIKLRDFELSKVEDKVAWLLNTQANKGDKGEE